MIEVRFTWEVHVPGGKMEDWLTGETWTTESYRETAAKTVSWDGSKWSGDLPVRLPQEGRVFGDMFVAGDPAVLDYLEELIGELQPPSGVVLLHDLEGGSCTV